jgi:hypothetical protein
MSGTPPAQPTAASPQATVLLLATFADLYRQEVGAAEDVHRTLPFFGTALGIILGALAYAAGRLPKWADLGTQGGQISFAAAAALLGLAIIEAGCVLVFLSRVIVRRDYERIGPETAFRARMSALRAYHQARRTAGDDLDGELLRDMQQVLLDSYAKATPINRELNRRRYRLRRQAAVHLIRSLIWALAATTVILVADKLGFLPKANP